VTGWSSPANPPSVSKFKDQGNGVNWGEVFLQLVPSNAIGAFAQGNIL